MAGKNFERPSPFSTKEVHFSLSTHAGTATCVPAVHICRRLIHVCSTYHARPGYRQCVLEQVKVYMHEVARTYFANSHSLILLGRKESFISFDSISSNGLASLIIFGALPFPSAPRTPKRYPSSGKELLSLAEVSL